MKLNRQNIPAHLLILVMAALVLGLMVQFAHAQSTSGSPQVLQTNMSQRNLGRKILENTDLTYYHQFLGPTLTGPGGETYNVFQEGRAPMQSFHAMNLRYNVNKDWAVGASLAAVGAYGETTTSQRTGDRGTALRDEFFNARFYLSLPYLSTPIGNLFTTVAYEAPTSVFSRNNDMRWGWVVSQSFAFKTPSIKWTAGLMGQIYRVYYEENVVDPGTDWALARQTMIYSVGPYMGYRFNDRWGVSTSVTFDWDQRGDQTETGSFNNNLDDRARVTASYYPSFKYISNIGVFTQANLDYTTDTQAFGAEFSLRL